MASENKNSEIRIIADKCYAIINYIKSKGAGEIMSEATKGIDLAVERNNLKGLKMALRDLCDWARDIEPDGKDIVFNIVMESETQWKQKTQSLLIKKELENDDEYRILLEYIDNHFADLEDSILDTANNLLSEYEKRVNEEE